MSRSSLSIAAHLSRLNRSGLSVIEYSKRYGVSLWSLYSLRSKQRKEAARSGHNCAALVSRNAPLTFTQLTSSTPIAFKSAEIELTFPDGIRASLPRGFDEAELRKVISVLSSTRVGVPVC
jgi:urease gamma subunit